MGLRVLRCSYGIEDGNAKEKYRDANGNENGRGAMGMGGYVAGAAPPVSHGRSPFSPLLFLPSSNHTDILPPHSLSSLFLHKQLAILITMPVAPVVGKVRHVASHYAEAAFTDTCHSSERGSSLTLPPRSFFVPFHIHATRRTAANTAIPARHSIGIGLAGAYTFWYTVHLPMGTC